MVVAEDKSWAEGLSEVEYVSEYQRRYPRADSFPNLATFLKDENRQDSFISPFDLEDMTVEDSEHDTLNKNAEKKPEKPKDRTAAVCACGKTYDHPNFKFAHLGRHQLKCKTFLNSR